MHVLKSLAAEESMVISMKLLLIVAGVSVDGHI